MSCVASFHSGFEACFVCDMVCKWSRCSLWLRSPVASNKVSFVVSSARGRTLPSGAALGSLGSVLGASGRDVLGRLLGCFGDALGRLLGASGASWEAFGSAWGLWGRLWVLRGRLREALECFQSISERLLGAPGTPWGASWGAFGTSWEAFWGSERALGAEKTQKWKSSFYLRNT